MRYVYSRYIEIFHIEINKVPIEQVNYTQFLGVIFDDRLEWSNHITYKNSKGSRNYWQFQL